MAFPTREAFLASLIPAPELEGRYEDPSDDTTGCGICRDTFTNAVRTTCNPPYSHIFCREHLEQWLQLGNDCPACRFVFFPQTPRPQQDLPADFHIVVNADGVFARLPLSPTASHQRGTLIPILRRHAMVDVPRGPPNPLQPRPGVFGPRRPPAMRQVYISEHLRGYVAMWFILNFALERNPSAVRAFVGELWMAALSRLRTWLGARVRETMQASVMREQLRPLLADAPDQYRDLRMTPQIVQVVEADRTTFLEELIEVAEEELVQQERHGRT
jgi:hypothetical protein